MRRVVSLTRSSVGKKVLMAVTGLFLFVFIVLHMAGNLKVFFGADSFNHYAEFLRVAGEPVLPPMLGLWTFRVALLVAVLVHMWAAFATWSASRRARERGYRKNKDLSFSYASRTMRWGGVILLLFIVYHILHFTTGNLHGNFLEGDVYHNFTTAFRNPLIVLVYLVAQAALCLHLYHGLWSATQTLGANQPKWNRYRRPLAAVVALAIFGGFMLPPLFVLFRFIG